MSQVGTAARAVLLLAGLWIAPGDHAASAQAPPLPDLTRGPGGITSIGLSDHIRALPVLPGAEARLRYVETFFAAHGVQPPGDVAPFAVRYRHRFTLSSPRLDPEAGPGAVLVRRVSGTVSFPALPFPSVPAVSDTGFTQEVIFLDPEGLAHVARTETSPKLSSGILVTVERDPEGDPASCPPESPDRLESRLGAALADQVIAAARLGAAALVIVRQAEDRSIYQPLLRSPSSEGWLHLPTATSLPDMLVLSAGPELGEELIGRPALMRQIERPTLLPEPAYRPMLLDLELGASAPVARESAQLDNIIGYLEGASPELQGEAVMISAIFPGPEDDPAGMAVMLEVARLFSDPSRRPPRSLLFAALDPQASGLAGWRSLSGRVPELRVKPISMLELDLQVGGEPTQVVLEGKVVTPEIRSAVEAAGRTFGLLARAQDEASDTGCDAGEESIAPEGIVAMRLASSPAPEQLGERQKVQEAERVARLAAMTVWALAQEVRSGVSSGR